MPSQNEALWVHQTVETDPAPKPGGEIVVFYTRQKKSDAQSRLQGRPVFREVIYCKIIQGGDNLTTWDQPVRDSDKEKYAIQWERWLTTKENRIPGTPIDAWPALSDTQKAEFKALNIFTVEQFATIADSVANKIMGFHQLRQRAKVFVEAGKDAELVGQIRAEAKAKEDVMQAQLDELKQALADQKKALSLAMFGTAKRRRPSNKPKNTQAVMAAAAAVQTEE